MRSGTGLSTFRSIFLRKFTSTIRQSLRSPFSYPARNFAISSRGAIVALSPILVICWLMCCSLSRLNERCTPLLFSASAWISSTTTQSTFFIWSTNLIEERIIERLSGVVMSMWGGFLSIADFSAGVVSPVLTATLIPNFFPEISSISFNGSTRFFSMSLLRAFRGEIYTQYTFSSSFPFSAESTSSLSMERKAVRVFVAPVGADIRMFFLLWISVTP